MNQIYNKINNHKYLNNKDIAAFINIESKGEVTTKFVDNPESIMGYMCTDCSVIVDKDIRYKRIKNLIYLVDAKLKRRDEVEDSNFLVDLYNIYLLNTILHELAHHNQYQKITETLNFKSKILKDNIEFTYYNPKLYYKNHDLYYHEYDAVIKSLIKTIKVINSNCINLNKKSIEAFNMIMARILFNSYGNRYLSDEATKMYENFESPITYTKYLSNCWQDKKERKILSICIKNLKSKSNTEYLKLINGFNLNEDTLTLLFSLSNGEKFTDNVLEEVKNMAKEKTKIK